MRSIAFFNRTASHLLAAGVIALFAQPLLAQPLNERDRLLLVDDALQYAAREDRNDATAVAKLEDVLKRVDNLVPSLEMQIRERIAHIYHDKALREVNRKSAIMLETRDLSAIAELSVNETEWRDAVNALEDFAEWAAQDFPIAAAKALEQTAHLYQWQRKALDERADVLIRLRALLSTITPESRDDRYTVESLDRRSQQDLRGLTPRLSAEMQARVRAWREREEHEREASENHPSDPDDAVGQETPRQDIATLLDRRAPERFKAAQRVYVADDQGNLVDMFEPELAHAGDMVTALRKAYAPIAISVEYGLAAPEERVPFDVLANMRLEDALNLMVDRTQGHSHWTVQANRLIVQFQETREGISIPSVLSRPFPARITADTVGDALLEVEVAYNAVYQDIPVELDRKCLTFLHNAPLPGDFLEEGATITVRDAIVKLLEALDTDGVMYYYADPMHFEPGQWFVQVSLSIPPPYCRDEFESGEEYEAFWAYLAERRARVNAYFDQRPSDDDGEN